MHSATRSLTSCRTGAYPNLVNDIKERIHNLYIILQQYAEASQVRVVMAVYALEAPVSCSGLIKLERNRGIKYNEIKLKQLNLFPSVN